MKMNTTDTDNINQFKAELKDLLKKYDMKMVLSCNDMTAYLSLDTNESVNNLICEQVEELYNQTFVNDYL